MMLFLYFFSFVFWYVFMEKFFIMEIMSEERYRFLEYLILDRCWNKNIVKVVRV